MSRVLLTGNGAAAWGARLAEVDYVPAFPITPQTEIIETLAAWFERGDMDGRLVTLESEHSMITAAAAAAATGVRVFTATSSQGLLYAHGDDLHRGRLARALRAGQRVARRWRRPITLEPDHTDVLAARDSGFLQIHCATCQEVLDSVLMAYRLAEHPARAAAGDRQPGRLLSVLHPRAGRDSGAGAVRRFLPAFDAESVEFRASRPVSQAVAVLGGSPYSYFRYETHLAAQQALARVRRGRATPSRAEFGRQHPAVRGLSLRRRGDRVLHDRRLRHQGDGCGGPPARRRRQGRAGAAAAAAARGR